MKTRSAASSKDKDAPQPNGKAKSAKANGEKKGSDDKKKSEDKKTGIKVVENENEDVLEVAPAQHYHYSVFSILFMIGFMIHCRKYPDENYQAIAMGHIAAFISVPRATTTLYQDVTFLSFISFCLYTTIADSPYNANHHNLCGYLCLLMIPNQLKRVFGIGDARQQTNDTLNVVRWNIIIMYSIAAFHKINHDFLFEPKVSCAYDMLRRYIDFVDEDLWDEDDRFIPEKMPWFMVPLPWMGLFVEMTPPILMMFQKTQKFGVLMLVSLHLLLLPVGFADFGSIAQSLLWLFVSPVPASKSLPFNYYTDMAGCFVFLHVIVFIVNSYESDEHTLRNEEVAMVLLAFAVHWAGIIRSGALWEGIKMRKPKSLISIFALCFFAFFGMNQYLGLRTTGTLTMFSNLRTEGEKSNHLILRNNPLKIFGYQEDIVEVLTLDPRFEGDARIEPGWKYQVINFNREMMKEKRWEDQYPDLYAKVLYKGEIYETWDLNNDPAFDIFRQPESWLSRKYLDFRDIQPYDRQDCEW
ncbi:MAG: hypothetical protein SGILL_007396 [Bacillariaceae sp.]